MQGSYEGLAILGLAPLAFAGAEIAGGNGFIAAFVAGLVFGNRMRARSARIFEFAEAEGQLLTLLTFLIFGSAILPEAWGNFGWATLLYAILSLTVVRMLPVALSLLGAGVRPPTTLFLGWFGPRGLASMLFALFVLAESEIPAADQILAVTILTGDPEHPPPRRDGGPGGQVVRRRRRAHGPGRGAQARHRDAHAPR